MFFILKVREGQLPAPQAFPSLNIPQALFGIPAIRYKSQTIIKENKDTDVACWY
jgi:hypothetical protein